MAKPFTIKLFMPSGNANELKLIEKMNWTGLGMEISRTAWPTLRKREKLQQVDSIKNCLLRFGLTKFFDLFNFRR